MKEQRHEIARVCFTGSRYDGHVLDAAALEEVVHFQKIVTEIAKVVWKKENPDRERLPKDFEERTQFVFRRIEKGSAVVPLEIHGNSDQLSIWEVPDEIIEAVDLAYDAYTAANRDETLPDGFPREALSVLAAFGKKLTGSAQIQFAPPGRELTTVTPMARQRLNTVAGHSYVDELEITGRVLEVDVRQGRFHIWMKDGTKARVWFTEQQESEVTTALKEHVSTQLFVKGQGEFSTEGALQEIQNVDRLKVIPDNETGFDASAPCIEDVISEIFNDVSDHEWDRVPTDLSHRHDFYLYRRVKR